MLYTCTTRIANLFINLKQFGRSWLHHFKTPLYIMVSTNLITFLITFTTTTESIIFNVSRESLNKLTETIKDQNLKLATVKQFDRSKNKFLKIPKQKLLTIIDHHTELSLLLNNNKAN